MKIAIFSAQFTPIVGGVPTVVTLLAREFQRAGHTVKVVTSTPADRPDPPDYEIVRQPGGMRLLRLHLWADFCIHQGCSVKLAWPVFIVKRACAMVHQMVWYGKNSPADRLRCAILKRCRNVAISNAVAASLPVPSSIIPNPYDDSVFKIIPDVPRDQDIVFLGRLEREKGAEDLIDGLAQLLRRGRRATLGVIGYGTLREKLEAKAAQSGLGDSVRFLGTMKAGHDLTVLLNRHRIMAVPSFWNEPFGIVALEGIACGCVIAGSAGGGLPDAIGPCGLTFPNGDVAGLADILERLLADPAKLNHYREQAQSHLARHLSVRIAKDYLAVSDEITRESAGKNVAR